MEYFLSGYCRCQDQSRRVLLEIDDGEIDVDCNFGACPYEAEGPPGHWYIVCHCRPLT